MRILIVDDSPVMRSIVRRSLRQAGFGGHAIEEAGDGRQALERIEKDPPDLVLSDWNMPEMTGIELLEEMTRRQIAVPLCFVTSEATSAMRAAACAAGARAFLTKPFTPEALAAALGDLID